MFAKSFCSLGQGKQDDEFHSWWVREITVVVYDSCKTQFSLENSGWTEQLFCYVINNELSRVLIQIR